MHASAVLPVQQGMVGEHLHAELHGVQGGSKAPSQKKLKHSAVHEFSLSDASQPGHLTKDWNQESVSGTSERASGARE